MKLKNPERFDIETAERVLEQVTRFPKNHIQVIPMEHNHSCGSVGCIMGWALHFKGFVVDYATDSPWYQRLLKGDVLGLNNVEFINIYSDGYEDSAINKLKDYIEQAHAAQDVHELSAADRAALDSQEVSV